MGVKYVCDECYGQFESEDDWTAADALAEKAIDFPDVPLSRCGVVCDDCYKRLVPQGLNA